MSNLFIPKGRLASDTALAAKRAELKRKLLEGGNITLIKHEDDKEKEGVCIQIPTTIFF